MSAFIAIQVAIPTIALFGERPQRWSWQMYSGATHAAEFTVIRDGGEENEVEPSDYMGKPRLDMAIPEYLPRHICDHDSSVLKVKTKLLLHDETVEFQCDR